MSGDQFVSFATSKALTSFIVYIIADFEVGLGIDRFYLKA